MGSSGQVLPAQGSSRASRAGALADHVLCRGLVPLGEGEESAAGDVGGSTPAG